MRLSVSTLFLFLTFSAYSQSDYWQQHVDYEMDVNFTDSNNQYSGTQELTYTNNSPDTLYTVFFHLYPNAFQPGSMMDVRSRTIDDPDARVGDRISKLAPKDQGFLKVDDFRQNGNLLETEAVGTILQVNLAKPIRPGKKEKFSLHFTGQSPVQIRRSGRDNAGGVAYSMSQWYPKMCEYDRQGWHADPYIAREFFGVWGDFDVTIKMDSSYTIAATGVLQNPEAIGHGYLPKGKKLKRPEGNMLSWNFKAENVHDFVWAADKDYIHDIVKMEDGPDLHFFYKNNPDIVDNWKKLETYVDQVFTLANAQFGKYPWPKFSVIQGGDGGMEYPMATLVTGERSLGSLVGTSCHEIMHEWYYCVLASNEGYYPWMDEGFATFAASKIMSQIFNPDEDTRTGSYYTGYLKRAKSGKEEPMSTRGDYFKTNGAYSTSSYSKGAVFVAQLGYIMGENVLENTLHRYFNTWKFKHPDPNDFLRIAEKESGMQLDWYLSYMMNTTETIDYGISRVEGRKNSTEVELSRIGNFPMPIDLTVTFRDSSKQTLNIPLTNMHKAKTAADDNIDWDYTSESGWQWTNPTYTVTLAKPISEILSVEIDPSHRMADIDRSNNLIEINPTTESIIIN